MLLIAVHCIVWKVRFGVSCSGHVGTNFVKIGEGFRTSNGHTHRQHGDPLSVRSSPFYETK